ncbi:MAG TPA: glycoside hydrolase family 2 TIM barrel-domain containing protein, partial [Arachidicoccus sp.]|nr:glycoside hydrolase family 2 TIM barrel-domain containing protein [Arachidicoccus sp.]
DSKYKGKHLSLEFEGVMQVSDVWINDKYIGRFTGGYLPFEIDLTDKVVYGRKNTILLKVNNKANPVVPPGKPVAKLDFIYYSGIYRDVWLHVQDELHITNSISANKVAGGGIFVSYPVVSKARSTVDIQTHVANQYQQAKQFTIEQELLDSKGHIVTSTKSPIYRLKPNEDKAYQQQIEVRNPALWHPDHPNLYTLKTIIKVGTKQVDEKLTRIGIRSFDISSEKGLLINGEPFNISGTNRHQNYPYIGNAISDNATYRDAWLIKAAGMNAVRSAHYPPDPSFLDAADELGILIINCIPGWQYLNKNPAFVHHSMQDIRQMIRRDRNHASILLWEVSINEVYPPADFRCKQVAVARSEFGNRRNFFTSGDSYFTKACYDVPYDDWNGDHGDRNNTTYPNNAFLIREYGDYEFGGGSSSSRQLRGAGERKLLQQAWNLQWAHNKNRKYAPRAIGDLTWAFYDGLAGVVVGIEGWGVADLFRIPKFSYYFFKSQQPEHLSPMLSFASGPMVRIASDWNAASDPSKLIVYSNCEKVELLINGKTVQRLAPDNGPQTGPNKSFDGGNANRLEHPPFTFKISGFDPGTVKAVGYVKGKPVAKDSVTTAGAFRQLKIELATHGRNWEKGGDIMIVYAKLLDQKGQLTASKQRVTFKIKGDASLMSPATVNAEAGIASFLVRSGDSKGRLELSAVAAAEGINVKGDLKVNFK